MNETVKSRIKQIVLVFYMIVVAMRTACNRVTNVLNRI